MAAQYTDMYVVMQSAILGPGVAHKIREYCHDEMLAILNEALHAPLCTLDKGIP